MLLEILCNYAGKWYEIGLSVGFTPAELNTIRADHQSVTECLRGVLEKWTEWPIVGHNDHPTLYALYCALRAPFVGLGRAAEEIVNKSGMGFSCSSSSCTASIFVVGEMNDQPVFD